jgi:hypothetical protein
MFFESTKYPCFYGCPYQLHKKFPKNNTYIFLECMLVPSTPFLNCTFKLDISWPFAVVSSTSNWTQRKKNDYQWQFPVPLKMPQKLSTKYVAIRKAWVTHAIVTDCIKTLDAKTERFYFSRTSVLFIFKTIFLKNVKVVFTWTAPAFSSHLDQGLIMQFIHIILSSLYGKQCPWLITSYFMKINASDAQHSTAEPQHSVTHTYGSSDLFSDMWIHFKSGQSSVRCCGT